MMGEATNCRKEKREPRRPPNKTGMKLSGAPTRDPKRLTLDSWEEDVIILDFYVLIVGHCQGDPFKVS